MDQGHKHIMRSLPVIFLATQGPSMISPPLRIQVFFLSLFRCASSGESGTERRLHINIVRESMSLSLSLSLSLCVCVCVCVCVCLVFVKSKSAHKSNRVLLTFSQRFWTSASAKEEHQNCLYALTSAWLMHHLDGVLSCAGIQS